MTDSGDLQFGLKPAVIDALRRVFEQFPEIACVLLYGSRAKGNFRQGSDIDLTVRLQPAAKEPSLLLSQIRERLDDLNLIYIIDLSLYEQIKNPELLEHINRVGVRLYG